MSKGKAVLIWMVILSFIVSANESALFEKPVRLKTSAGKAIDTGRNFGHSGPCMADVDGDGIKDLVVGDFLGNFTFYRNKGTNSKPSFEAGVYLQAGGKPAKVRSY